MAEILWKVPFPTSALWKDPALVSLGKRECELSFSAEGPDGEERKISLLFEGVEAYKCTHMTSLTAEMIKTAYDKLVRLGRTDWLAGLEIPYKEFHRLYKSDAKALQHLMICFDDGPCYEIVCVDFQVRE